MTEVTPNAITASDFIKLALEKGMGPAEINAELRSRGLSPFRYSYTGHCGKRAVARYGRQVGLCSEGCGTTGVPKDRTPRVCDACLESKWGGV
jgi:hypothetical protein